MSSLEDLAQLVLDGGNMPLMSKRAQKVKLGKNSTQESKI